VRKTLFLKGNYRLYQGLRCRPVVLRVARIPEIRSLESASEGQVFHDERAGQMIRVVLDD
jgi:hypothetical protein